MQYLLTIGLAAFICTKGFAVAEDEKAKALFENLYAEYLELRPEVATRQGKKIGFDRWRDYSIQGESKVFEQAKEHLKRLKTELSREKLNQKNQLVYDLIKFQYEQELEAYQWRVHHSPINHMRGVHKEFVSLLTNYHTVDSLSDAQAYLKRLGGIPSALQGVSTRLDRAVKNKIYGSHQTYTRIQDALQKILKSLPIADNSSEQLFFSDFRNKVETLKISDKDKQALLKQAKHTLNKRVHPALQKFLTKVKKIQAANRSDDGLWRNPKGKEYYQNRLNYFTSTQMRASEVHQLGLREVSRIHGEMKLIKDKVGYKGTLQEFFTHMRSNKKFILPNTDEGRKLYIDSLEQYKQLMKDNIHLAFSRMPIAKLEIKRVEPYREKNSSAAFYQSGVPDGSKPGVYYANLADMNGMPTYLAESLFYHEAVPGHHFERSISIERQGVPQFQRYFKNTAYTEGWALYAEALAKELGGFKDPYSDFGRLNWELRRALRLVVDTGLHDQGWSRQKAIDYFKNNSSFPMSDVVNQIDRYLVIPGQATAYKIGMIKIQELRQLAEEKLGKKFVLAEFHDFLLGQGPLPLTIVESQVMSWIEMKGR
ncbi:DUF885 domain-containing protein [Pseudobacteriovorax antillogorgiicola]|uniref:Uncharacterized conserved protein, DUF885 familyt n=1 Tax=Pseudobacteriovorax antillogorgiicola TaxID=1513793 RepID=A0A1Y6CPK3_9BACT|nr:DUF885 domain-containing protein [Pseudobacteriovorax antillogorgiicola]TCS42859.1 uncharacterized protein (DUF885 family) [Pseudobacteriovorax antillogorgiicola]SMF81988.1 Uncharacterized conserved protein, DUF885 familyt [Pseudobacteriovorax antillogorgiicola]